MRETGCRMRGNSVRGDGCWLLVGSRQWRAERQERRARGRVGEGAILAESGGPDAKGACF